DDALRAEGAHPGDELVDALGGVVEALADAGGSGVGVEGVFTDVDADQDAAHSSGLRNHEDESRGPTALLFGLVDAGFAPSDYSNRGSPIPEPTQLTPGPMKSLRLTVSLQNGLVVPQPRIQWV